MKLSTGSIQSHWCLKGKINSCAKLTKIELMLKFLAFLLQSFQFKLLSKQVYSKLSTNFGVL